MKKIVIAIDGHSSGGKSTMARELAREIGYTYIDTGAMYRALTLYALRQGLFAGGRIEEDKLRAALPGIHISFRMNEQTGRTDTWLNGVNVEKEIRGMDVAAWVSPLAALPFVRRDLVARQQEMGKEKGIVMDGRDIGTVVFPEAELKIFVTASPEVRAQRRLDEMRAKGETASFEEVLENVKKRDLIDSTRREGPLRQAGDALLLDNSAMSPAEQKVWLMEQYLKTINT
ncbi:MAG: (d)CMP kinase [Tannerellaceae bacterium]|jgi:cytidylate kinase|nr:(d)CMP kinase [Tannerellaceae bacterium]